ncbi:hypothetical protein BGZ93_001461 [Podila epicladia]|nr:hypothetical protein BGZ92_008697 [Podila epicladia]KAG0097990.1 hypothetical protein BGZ93_001461 [Podila epicladia]
MATPVLSLHSYIGEDELRTLLAPSYKYHSNIEVETRYSLVQAQGEFGNNIRACLDKQQREREEQQIMQLHAMNIDESEDQP